MAHQVGSSGACQPCQRWQPRCICAASNSPGPATLPAPLPTGGASRAARLACRLSCAFSYARCASAAAPCGSGKARHSSTRRCWAPMLGGSPALHAMAGAPAAFSCAQSLDACTPPAGAPIPHLHLLLAFRPQLLRPLAQQLGVAPRLGVKEAAAFGSGHWGGCWRRAQGTRFGSQGRRRAALAARPWQPAPRPTPGLHLRAWISALWAVSACCTARSASGRCSSAWAAFKSAALTSAKAWEQAGERTGTWWWPPAGEAPVPPCQGAGSAQGAKAALPCRLLASLAPAAGQAAPLACLRLKLLHAALQPLRVPLLLLSSLRWGSRQGRPARALVRSRLPGGCPAAKARRPSPPAAAWREQPNRRCSRCHPPGTRAAPPPAPPPRRAPAGRPPAPAAARREGMGLTLCSNQSVARPAALGRLPSCLPAGCLGGTGMQPPAAVVSTGALGCHSMPPTHLERLQLQLVRLTLLLGGQHCKGGAEVATEQPQGRRRG